MLGFQATKAEVRLWRDGHGDWRACSAGDAEFSKTLPSAGDGVERRVAGVGDGVLFYDPDNTGEITERRQYVFTDWDWATGSDMAAHENA